MKRGMIFIDGSNVYFDYKKVSNGKSIDIEKYIESIKTLFPAVEIRRTYYFTSESTNNQGFLQTINRIPYVEVVRGRLQAKTISLDNHNILCPQCNSKISQSFSVQIDKGTDVNIAVEMLKHAYNKSYDVAILASRDADFAGVVRIIKDIGCTVELVLFDGVKGNAQELTDNVDNVTIISDYSSCERVP